MLAKPPLPTIPVNHSIPSTGALKVQPPQKHVDKSQKQQFVVELPSEAISALGNLVSVNIDRKHFLPPVLLTGIAKQQKEEKTKSGVNLPVQGELSIQVLSREDKEITFEKCERCQEKDSHIFPLFENAKIDAAAPNSDSAKQHPRNCFALIGTDKIQFEKGRAVLPVYFRCCPTHHTSKKGENVVQLKVKIIKDNTFVYESEFVKVQWKKGKHSRQSKMITPTPVNSATVMPPTPSTNSVKPIVSTIAQVQPAVQPTTSTTPATVITTLTQPGPTFSTTPSVPTPVPAGTTTSTVTTTTTTREPTSASQLSPFSLAPNPLMSSLNTGVPPYQAYMNMFQHLQTYYVQPLEEENKKLRKELVDSSRNVALLKDENRKLRDISFAQRDDHFLDQLKSYQFEAACAPVYHSMEEDEESGPEDDVFEDISEKRPIPIRKSMREAMKLMKFKSRVKLILLKHNGTHWYEPVDRSAGTYVNNERLGIRIINKNPFPVLVRLHRVNFGNTCTNIPLCNDDFLQLDGCKEAGNWETAYFDLGHLTLPQETPEAIELLKLLVKSGGSEEGNLSTIVARSYNVRSAAIAASSITTTNVTPIITTSS